MRVCTARRRCPCAALERPQRSAGRAAASWTRTACSVALLGTVEVALSSGGRGAGPGDGAE